MIDPWIQTIMTVICSVIASSGFWVFMTRYADKNDAKTEMPIGFGHDRIVNLGMTYIEREYIAKDEYENLQIYLYNPYKNRRERLRNKDYERGR